jgi:hypothetical protein
MGFSAHWGHQQLAPCECSKSEMRSMKTIIKTTHGAQFKSQNRRDRFVRACAPGATRHVGLIGSPYSSRVPEELHGSVDDPRISYPPVIVKSDEPKQLFIRFVANSYQKLVALVVRIKELLCAPGIL